MSSNTLLIYGANGYTGGLVARMAVRQGLRPMLAARNPVRVAPLAAELGLDYRSFALDDVFRDRHIFGRRRITARIIVCNNDRGTVATNRFAEQLGNAHHGRVE